MKTVHYRNRKLRLIAAFTASVYILFHGRPFDIYRALTSLSFYIAFAVSFGIGLLLVHVVHRVTLWLDNKCSWRERPVERSVMQFTLGILAPAFADLVLISIYFQALGQDILTNGFLLIDYPVIVFFIILLNVYYLIHYLLLTENQGNKPEKYDTIESIANSIDIARQINTTSDEESETENDPISILTIEHKGVEMHLELNNIICFYRSGKRVRVLMADRKDYPINRTIASLKNNLPAGGFSQINRAMIINQLIVKGYKSGIHRDTLELVIKQKFQIVIRNLSSDQFTVTKEYILNFKNDFQASQEEN